MTENQLTLTEQEEIFGNLCKKPLTLEERGVQGAKIFKRKISGICGIRKRAETEIKQLLIEMGLVGNLDGAQSLLKSLEGRAITYGGILRHEGGGFYERPSLAKYFRLEKLEGEKVNYRIYSWNTLPQSD